MTLWYPFLLLLYLPVPHLSSLSLGPHLSALLAPHHLSILTGLSRYLDAPLLLPTTSSPLTCL